MNNLEHIPPEEPTQIKNIARLTIEQLKKRYPGVDPVLRGVHAKDHGCVTAKFKVDDTVPVNLRVGVFATPGKEYEAWVRYSNAAVSVAPDSIVQNGVPVHGSRGMAVKLLGVSGSSLVPTIGPLTQDFLMINSPVFAFANVEDYEAVSQILLKDNDNPARFFRERIHVKPDGTPDLADPITQRALRSLGIANRISSSSVTANPPAFQTPPASPVDNRYFSGAAYLFGEDRAMKFSTTPVAPDLGAAPNVADPNYLRTALRARLTASNAQDVVIDFLIQIREAAELAGKIDTEVEDACFEWDETKYPFAKVATITIAPQDFDTAARRAQCENLIFTPWHGIREHQPLGGINRLRRAVYEASADFRHIPKEPEHL